MAKSVARTSGTKRTTGFARMQPGEGIDKKDGDFAAEMAKMPGAPT